MKTYKISFFGRLKGAIGISYPCYREIEAESKEEALLKLYDTHEHIYTTSIIEGEAK